MKLVISEDLLQVSVIVNYSTMPRFNRIYDGVEAETMKSQASLQII